MYKKYTNFRVFFLSGLLLTVVFSGCIDDEKLVEYDDKNLNFKSQFDHPSQLPEWKDEEYHDYYATVLKLNDFNKNYEELVTMFTIGESVLGKDIWCIKVTNKNNEEKKYTCLIDGCIHGSEWESGEACLYLTEYLLINYGKNHTVTNILNTTEIFIIPIVNPDGRQENVRWNENGVDLNRNFDVDFGRIIGRSIRIGKLFGKIKIPKIKLPIFGSLTNSGRRPFTEPGSQALRDFMKSLSKKDFSFYLNLHTATHNIITPWFVFKPPFEMTLEEKNVFEYVKNWVAENTEYEAYQGYGIFSEGKDYLSGTAMDWCFKEFRIPSFIFELLSIDYDPMLGGGKHDHLVHWMKTALPVFLFLLVNVKNLHKWKIPDIEPVLPKGIPPEPIDQYIIRIKND